MHVAVLGLAPDSDSRCCELVFLKSYFRQLGLGTSSSFDLDYDLSLIQKL